MYEPEAATVRRIFPLYADGLTISDIVTMLNDEGVPAARTPRIAPSRTWWSPSLVKRILKRNTSAQGFGTRLTNSLTRGRTRL